MRPARSVGPHVAKPVRQNPHQLEAELVDQRSQLMMLVVDHVAARFGVLPLDEAIADGPDASADAVPRLHDRDVGAKGGEVVRGGESGESSAGDEDGHTREVRHGCSVHCMGNRHRLRETLQIHPTRHRARPRLPLT